MKHVMKNHKAMWKLCFQTEPRFMLYLLFDAFRYEFCIFLEHTIGINLVLSCAEEHKPFAYVAIYMIGLTVLIGILMIFDGYYNNRMIFKSKPKLYQALKQKMYAKAYELDLACYDDPEYYDKFVLSVSEAEKCIDRFLELLGLIMRGITIILTTGGFFLVKDPVGILFSMFSFFLTFFFAKKLNKVNVDTRLESNPKERKRNYIQRVSYLNDYAKELRVNPQINDVLTEEFEQTNDEIEAIERKVSKKRCLLGFLKNYVASDFITDGLYIIYLVFQAAVLHNITYSTAVVLFNSVGLFKNGLKEFSKVLPNAGENSMYIDKIEEFIHYEPRVVSTENLKVPDTPQTIELRNVSFAYNDKDGDILKNINMTLRPSEKVALVGYNGAGKTTLIKVLMRLYDPTEGQILYGGTDIKKFNIKEYREKIGVVFQDFKMYGADLCENVVLDDLKKVTVDREQVTEALIRSGFKQKLEELDQGLDTPITTEFDKKGVNLSGGESQKVAISRVFYHDNEIMVMDEPSSALDPIAEYGLNKAMHEAAKHKAVVYISHRLSTTRDADYIYMLEKGQIIEEGTHDELLEKNGKYEEMWDAQAGRYVGKRVSESA